MNVKKIAKVWCKKQGLKNLTLENLMSLEEFFFKKYTKASKLLKEIDENKTFSNEKAFGVLGTESQKIIFVNTNLSVTSRDVLHEIGHFELKHHNKEKISSEDNDEADNFAFWVKHYFDNTHKTTLYKAVALSIAITVTIFGCVSVISKPKGTDKIISDTNYEVVSSQLITEIPINQDAPEQPREAEQPQQEECTVYWINNKNNGVYHIDPNCRYIKDKPDVSIGKPAEAEEYNKSRFCKVCKK